jgi:hypothetical protein
LQVQHLFQTVLSQWQYAQLVVKSSVFGVIHFSGRNAQCLMYNSPHVHQQYGSHRHPCFAKLLVVLVQILHLRHQMLEGSCAQNLKNCNTQLQEAYTRAPKQYQSLSQLQQSI